MVNRYLAVGSMCAFFAGILFATFAESRIYLPHILKSAVLTVELTVWGTAICIIVSFVFALGKLSTLRPVRWTFIFLIEALRGTSLLVYLFWIFFVLPDFGVTLEPFDAAIIAIGLNYGAYGAEIVRGAILSIPKGQLDAADALSMPSFTRMRRIILPQVLIIMVPPFGNLIIELLKGTALTSAITLTDMTFAAVSLNQMHFDTVQIFGIVMVVYYALAQLIRAFTSTLEDRLTRHLRAGRN